MISLGLTAPDPVETLLLRAALLPREQAAVDWTRWRAADTVESSHHRVHALLSVAAANVPSESLGSDGSVLQGLRRRAWLVNERQRVSLRRALESLLDAGCAGVPVRGSWWLVADARAAPPRPVVRNDIWVTPREWAAARVALQGAGWCLAPGRRRSESDAWLVAADGERLVLTWGYCFPRHSRRIPARHVDEAARWQDLPVPRMQDAAFAVMTIIEGLTSTRHEPLVWPVDVQAVMRANEADPSFWEDVVAVAHELGQGPLVAAALEWCAANLDLEVPDAAVGALSAGTMDRVLAYEHSRAGRGSAGSARLRRLWDIRRAPGVRPARDAFGPARA